MKNSVFFDGHASGFDKSCRIHQVTAVGVRNEHKSQCLEGLNTSMNRFGNGTFSCKVAPTKTFTFEVSYAVSNPDDTIDIALGNRIAKRRLKNDEFKTIILESDKIIPDPICQSIVDAEANRIAANVDAYIAKLKRI